VSIATYAELQTAVATWAHRADIATPAPDLIMLGEKWIFRNVRAREMETALSGTISSGTLAVPTGFRQLKHARVATSPVQKLTITTPDSIYEDYPVRSGGSIPKFIAEDAGSFIFGPYPGNYDIAGTYYKALTSIASSANALFLANPDLYLFAALAEATPYMKDLKMAAVWTAKRDGIKDDINEESMQGRYGAGMAVTLG
jgi:hypothetical protein